MVSEYPYSENDLLKNPQGYQKSPFLGIGFLKSYKKNRLNILNQCKSTSFSPIKFIRSFNVNVKINLAKFKLENYLEYLLIISQSNSDSIIQQLDVLIKKFEIKKKLFTEYESNFIEISSDYSYLRNYILFDMLCLLQYEKYHSLKYLNTCLKINDILCSQYFKISEHDQLLFHYLIKKELEYVNSLCKRKNILI